MIWASALSKLLEFDDRAANYVRDMLYFGFAYAAHVAPEIAYKLSDVDDADALGLRHMRPGPSRCGICSVWRKRPKRWRKPAWKSPIGSRRCWTTGHESFYSDGSVYDFSGESYETREVDKKDRGFKRPGCRGKEYERQPVAIWAMAWRFLSSMPR